MQDINLKKWWSNIKLLFGLLKFVLFLCIIIDGIFLRDIDFVEVINDFFSNVVSDIFFFEFIFIFVYYIFDEYIISFEVVECLLLVIKECKLCGFDEIFNWVLKNFVLILCCLVCFIFNFFIS